VKGTARLHLAGVVIEQIGGKRPAERNRGEKAVYEAAIKVGIRALAPRAQIRSMIDAYEEEIEAERARASALNKQRAEAKQKTQPVPEQGGA